MKVVVSIQARLGTNIILSKAYIELAYIFQLYCNNTH